MSDALRLALIVLGIELSILGVGFWLGRRMPAAGHDTQGLPQALLGLAAFLTLLSVADLIGVGILTLWPSTLFLGFTLGWATKRRAKMA
jgi:hypothetical protein